MYPHVVRFHHVQHGGWKIRILQNGTEVATSKTCTAWGAERKARRLVKALTKLERVEDEYARS